MALGAFLIAAALLSIERICYVWVWRRPAAFAAGCRRRAPGPSADPTTVLQRMFYGFKALQMAVFAGWCLYFAGGSPWPPTAPPVVIAVGVLLIVAGQALSTAVFHKLGSTGVFYGNRFGHELPWVTGFPFNLVKHPQYLGAVLSIWGLFLLLRFPSADWPALPALETLYYALGAHYEQ